MLKKKEKKLEEGKNYNIYEKDKDYVQM